MSKLLEISESINRYINMTVTVLDMTVDVVDLELVRVAAMGKFNTQIGERVNHGSIFSEVMREKKDLLIAEPQNSKYCKDCNSLEFCGRFARLYTPITVDDAIVGAICLHSNTKKQNEIVINNISHYTDFIHSLSDLISLKVKEHSSELLQRYNLDLQQQLINLIDEGVIIFNSNHHIQYLNEKSEYTLGCNINQIGYLEKHNMFSIVEEKKSREKIRYRIRVRDKTVVLEGRTYEITNANSNENNSVFIFRGLLDESTLVKNNIIRDLKLEDLIGNSQEYTDVIEKCKKSTYRRDPILLEGESGTGKNQIAIALHNEKILKEGRFIVIGQDESLQTILSNGATNTSKGEAVCDTIFINEIVKLNWDEQNCLLALVNKHRANNAQIICCTQYDFKEQMQIGNVNPDLYYALDIYRIRIPSLIERGGDISLLTEVLLEEANKKYNRNITFSKSLQDLMKSYSWRGNVSELKNFIYHVVEQSGMEDKKISENEIPAFLLQKIKSNNMQNYNLSDLERKTIIRALNELEPRGFSKREIAKALGIGSATLYRKMTEYEIDEVNYFR